MDFKVNTEELQKEFKKLFGERLKKIRESSGLSRNKVSELTGLAISTIQLWEQGERDPSASNIKLLADLYKVGILDFFQQEMNFKSTYNKVCITDTLGNAVDTEEFYFVPRYNIEVSAGHGSFVDDEQIMFTMAFRKFWIDHVLGVNARDLAVIRAKGDSMIGEINDRDVLLINTADRSIRDGIYVIRLGTDLVVKRIQNLLNGLIEVVSANTVYRPLTINLSDIPHDFEIVGRVIWFGRAIP